MGEGVGQKERKRKKAHLHKGIRSPLRHHDDGSNLLHHGIIRWRDAVDVAMNLRAEIGDSDELLEDVFGEDIGVAILCESEGGENEERTRELLEEGRVRGKEQREGKNKEGKRK